MKDVKIKFLGLPKRGFFSIKSANVLRPHASSLKLYNTVFCSRSIAKLYEKVSSLRQVL